MKPLQTSEQNRVPPLAFHARLHGAALRGAPASRQAARVRGGVQQRHIVALLAQVLGGAKACRVWHACGMHGLWTKARPQRKQQPLASLGAHARLMRVLTPAAAAE